MTQALGINGNDEVVGVYQVGTGDSAATRGFTWTAQHGSQTVDDPHGVCATTIDASTTRASSSGSTPLRGQHGRTAGDGASSITAADRTTAR